MFILSKKIFFFTYVIFVVVFAYSKSFAAFENQIVELSNCENPDLGKANIEVDINDREIFLELEDDGIAGYLPLNHTTKKGIFSKTITFEE